MKADPVYRTLDNIVANLSRLGVPYAVAGGLAVVAHGYRRTTEDVDILVTREGLETIHKKLVGLGYLPVFQGSRNLRDTQTGVRVEFIITGQYPGDGKPKPVAFPDPAGVIQRMDDISYLALPALIELKLASGMSSPGRLKDLADVQELIKALDLDANFADRLHPYVRTKFVELAQAVRDENGKSPLQ